jgi:hypothetical protein
MNIVLLRGDDIQAIAYQRSGLLTEAARLHVALEARSDIHIQVRHFGIWNRQSPPMHQDW